VAADERFERQGDDLYTVVKVDALEAIVGTTVEVEGILKDEHINVKIPAGCQNGERIEVERHGMPRLNMISRGKLICVVQIVVPTNLTKAQLLDIASIVAARTIDEKPNPSAAEGEPDDNGESSGKDAAAEHFAEEDWRPPKNPFKNEKGDRKGSTRSKSSRRSRR
jgi:molecular chaperone DnaJ